MAEPKDRTVQIVAPIMIEVPRPPNYLRPAGTKGDAPMIPVESLSVEQLQAVGAAFTEALIANAARRRESYS